MHDKILGFYEPLADHYHLIFEDWDRAIQRQATVLSRLLDVHLQKHPLKVLDCACGIGTQALGLASLGHHVVASDLSPAEVDRARREAAQRHLDLSFHVSDMTSLQEIPARDFDLVVALDNALPHLSASQLVQAITAIGSKLRPGGQFLASIRDYDTLVLEKPAMQQPAFFGESPDRRIVHQVWDWVDESNYTLHLYLTQESNQQWKTHHFVSEYRALPREELSTVLQSAGFEDIRWLMPEESGFYQPLVLARRP